MGSQLKVDDGSVTVQVRGDGPLGTIVCVADSQGYARGYLQKPGGRPAAAAGRQAQCRGRGVGRGQLVVVKDIGLKEPVSGMVGLVNGEIAEDVTRYFAESEQIPSACALGVLVDTDQSVKQAGGYLVQLMPGARDSDIDRLEQNIQKAGAMTAMLDRGMTLEQIAEAILDGFTVHFLDEAEIGYRCNCSEAKVTRALISLGEGELLQMADEGKPAEITCQFCDRVYTFTPESLRALAQSAQEKLAVKNLKESVDICGGFGYNNNRR